jgi:hypothetical protein
VSWLLGGDGAAAPSAADAAAAPPLLRPAAWVEAYDPRPLPGAVLTHPAYPSLRLTLLSPSLVRMEFSPSSPPQFSDAGSYFAVHRARASVPAHNLSLAADGSLELATAALTLRFGGAGSDGGASPRSLRARGRHTVCWRAAVPAALRAARRALRGARRLWRARGRVRVPPPRRRRRRRCWRRRGRRRLGISPRPRRVRRRRRRARPRRRRH